MQEALKTVFSEELIAFKKAEENGKEMLIRRKILMFLMDDIHENFILDDIPAISMEAKNKLKSLTFSKEAAIKILDELESTMNKLF